MLDGTEFFECICGSNEHTLKFVLDLDENGDPRLPELFVGIFLHNPIWYKRIWIGVKYIFGYKSRFGHFGGYTMNFEDGRRMINMIKKLIRAHEEIVNPSISKKKTSVSKKKSEGVK